MRAVIYESPKRKDKFIILLVPGGDSLFWKHLLVLQEVRQRKNLQGRNK